MRVMAGSDTGLYIVTGHPSAVANHVITLLAGRGEQVAVVVRPRDLAETRRWARTLGGQVTVYAGDPGAVDLGLDGVDAAHLQQHLTAFFHLEPPPLFGRSGRPLRAAREVVMFAAGARPPARLVALSRIRTGGGISSISGGSATGLRGLLSEGRTPLSRILSGRGSTLGGVTLKTGVPVDPEGVWSTSPEGKLLHLLVLMHLSVDIRRFRSVSSRRLVLTSAPLAARTAVLLGEAHATMKPDLGDPRPPTLAEVDRALSGMLEAIAGVDAEFLSTCRRHADEIGARWTGGEDPVDVLGSFTVTESRGGGERLARELDLPWVSTLDVLEQSLDSVVADMRADIRQELEVETRDALLR